MQTDEDDGVVRAMLRGDRRAAEEMVERTYAMIFSALARLCGGDPDKAADLTQETYRRAWQSLDQFDGRARFSTWLYRIGYNTFLNSIRTPRPLVPLDGGSEHFAADGPQPDERAVRGEEERRLRAAVLALPDDLRFVVTAHYWGEVPVRELAESERVTTVAIRKRLHRAIERLEKALRKGRS